MRCSLLEELPKGHLAAKIALNVSRCIHIISQKQHSIDFSATAKPFEYAPSQVMPRYHKDGIRRATDTVNSNWPLLGTRSLRSICIAIVTFAPSISSSMNQMDRPALQIRQVVFYFRLTQFSESRSHCPFNSLISQEVVSRSTNNA